MAVADLAGEDVVVSVVSVLVSEVGGVASEEAEALAVAALA